MKHFPILLISSALMFFSACSGQNQPPADHEPPAPAKKKTPAVQTPAAKPVNAEKEVKKETAPCDFDAPPAAGTKAFCPVMKNEFTVKEDSPRSEYKGRHYVFCCPGCKPKFDEDPQKYIGSGCPHATAKKAETGCPHRNTGCPHEEKKPCDCDKKTSDCPYAKKDREDSAEGHEQDHAHDQGEGHDHAH